MIYICTHCSNYSYDESRWDKVECLETGTLFDYIDFDFTCPTCGASKDFFLSIKEEVLEANDKNNLSYLEKAHIPKVEIKWEECTVEVGYDIHPMIEEHYVYSIWLYDEYWDLVEEKLLTFEDEPIANFDISDFDEFEIRSRCNNHWVWTSWIIKNI